MVINQIHYVQKFLYLLESNGIWHFINYLEYNDEINYLFLWKWKINFTNRFNDYIYKQIEN